MKNINSSKILMKLNNYIVEKKTGYYNLRLTYEIIYTFIN
jgi:predicted DNA-binding protein (UPF0278 family)